MRVGVDRQKYSIQVRRQAPGRCEAGRCAPPQRVRLWRRKGLCMAGARTLAKLTAGCPPLRARPRRLSPQIPLPPKIDASVTMMTVEEKPDVTYG